MRHGPADGRPLVFHVGTPSAPDEFPPLTDAARRARLAARRLRAAGIRGLVAPRGPQRGRCGRRRRRDPRRARPRPLPHDRLVGRRAARARLRGAAPGSLRCGGEPRRRRAVRRRRARVPRGHGAGERRGVRRRRALARRARSVRREVRGRVVEGDRRRDRGVARRPPRRRRPRRADRRVRRDARADVPARGVGGHRRLVRRRPGLREAVGVRPRGDRHAGVDLAGSPRPDGPVRPRQWLAAHVPGARVHLYDDEGHLSLVRQTPRILDDLVSRADA